MQEITTIDTSSIAAADKSLRDQAVRFIRFEMADLMGLSRSKTVPIDSFVHFSQNGLNMYGGTLGLDSASFVVPGTGIGEEHGYPDARLFPELQTLRILPWETESASVICTPCYAGTGGVMMQSPRAVLASLIDRAQSLGFTVRTGLELEFYLLDAETKEPVFGDQHIFATLRNHWNGFINELMDNLNGMGLRLITHNAEYGPGQFEINFAPADGVAAADEAFRFKTAVKELAQRAGYVATFMSKPFPDKAGSGCHVHIGLRNLNNDTNAYIDLNKDHQLSSIANQFTAGLLQHASAMTALIAPTVNCYHRFVQGSFAPIRASWGIEDRTALIRMKATGDDATHLEMRGASGLSNPYISASATLAAGLLGLESDYNLPQLSDGLAEEDERFTTLPHTLESALDALASDKSFCEMLGKPFIDLFIKVKEYELSRWRAHISDWEHSEYLEMY